MEISISKQQLIALFGAILLLIGAFLPVLSAPIVGSVSLFNNGKSDGMIIAGLAVIAIIEAAQVRTRAVGKKLKEVQESPSSQAAGILDLEDD